MSSKAVPNAELLARLGDEPGYSVPAHPAPIDVYLASNEGRPAANLSAPERWLPAAHELARYPDHSQLTRALAEKLGVREAELLVTAGADDALFRACTRALGPGREAVVPSPTFEMISRYVELAHGTLVEIDWTESGFPLAETVAAINENTGLLVVVSPNNPTGQIISAEELLELSRAAKNALFILDLAYNEFAEADLTELALTLDNVVILRTLSKAWGLAGLRVGYAVGPQALIRALASAGNPYPVSRLSLALAEARFRDDRDDMDDYVAAARRERVELAATCQSLGLRALESHANFVFARSERSVWIRDALAGLGIGIRIFPGRARLEDALRITCPGEQRAFSRVTFALQTALQPQAILWDMDGVLADVSRSFRRAIHETAKSYGVELPANAIDRAKAEGGANDDWELTQRLLEAEGVRAELNEVTERFEQRYQGTPETPGLYREERVLPSRESLEQLAGRLPMAIVTGRPRSDAERFLADHDLVELFPVVICREDAPLKPDPAPVTLALEKLEVERAWMLGDTPDDVRAAKRAGVVPLGVLDFELTDEADRREGAEFEAMSAALLGAGAARVITRMSELEELL